MKCLFVACVAVASVAAVPAYAADLTPPIYTKAPVAAAPSWTGCYLGGNGGFDWSYVDWFDPLVGADEGHNTSTGALAGGQIGCDYQAGRYVFGIQNMLDWTNIDGSHPYTDAPGYIDHSSASWLDTLTGRIGYLVQPSTLLYVKGGGAWVRDNFTETCSPAVDITCPGSTSATRSGWTLGAGLEYRFAPNWSLVAEYDYADFGRRTETLVYNDLSTYQYGIRQNLQTLLLGVNFRFAQ